METQNENLKDQYYSTRSILLASTLLSLKFYLSGVDFQFEGENNRPVAYFLFEKNNDLNDAIGKYHRYALAIEPHAFNMSMRSIREMIANEYKKPQ